ncbi:MAG: sugar transporter, partial [Flavobacteriales bacterium]|nr:sugar transporter [Flavobacteriales bacterium]
YDKSFGINVAYYEERTKFYQKIKPLSDSFKIQGVIKYMACNENKCLTLDFEFEVAVNRQD